MTRPGSHRHVGLFFSNFEGGGIQRVRLRLAQGLLEQGWRVDLILVQARGPLVTEVPGGCNIFDLRAGRSRRSLVKLVGYLRSERPAVLISSQTHLSVVAVLARFLSGWKGRLLLSEHITLDVASRNPTKWMDRFSPFLASVFFRRADKIIVVSKEAARHFVAATGLPETMLKVLYNPLDTQDVIVRAKSNLDHVWFNTPNTPVFLAVGRLTPQKDFETLLRAFRLVRDRVLAAKLIILGEGEERARLEQLAQELGLLGAVQFPGFVLNPFAYMARAAVLVLSSRWEGFPNVLTEALACGTAVVSTDCPSGPAEILDNGTYGMLVPVGDVSGLARAMIETLQHPLPKPLLQERANRFSLGQIVPEYIETMLGQQDQA